MSRLQWVISGRLPWSGVWLNRHYIAGELAKEERVVYLLDPRPLNPLRRAREEAGTIGGEAPDGVRVIRLPEPPLQRFSPMRRLGHRRARSRVLRELEDDSTVLVYLPRARLFQPGAIDEALTVYYCSDDFRFHHDGTRDRTYCEWEDEALARADLVIGVSDPLWRGLAARHSRVRLVENGFDPAIFHPVEGSAPAEVADLPHPRIGFVGSVRAPLIDLDLVADAATARPDWSFCLVGWFDEDDPGIAKVRALENVLVTGPRPREELAGYISAMDVMTCPYVRSRVTAPGLPLKAFEALAVGKPLVGVHAPLLDERRPYLRNTESLGEFLAALEEVLADPPEIDPDAAAAFTWGKRAMDFRGHVAGAME